MNTNYLCTYLKKVIILGPLSKARFCNVFQLSRSHTEMGIMSIPHIAINMKIMIAELRIERLNVKLFNQRERDFLEYGCDFDLKKR